MPISTRLTNAIRRVLDEGVPRPLREARHEELAAARRDERLQDDLLVGAEDDIVDVVR